MFLINFRFGTLMPLNRRERKTGREEGREGKGRERGREGEKLIT